MFETWEIGETFWLTFDRDTMQLTCSFMWDCEHYIINQKLDPGTGLPKAKQIASRLLMEVLRNWRYEVLKATI